MRLTPDLLQAATGCKRDRALAYAPLLADACAHYGIDTPVRLAAFLAQIGHESGTLQYTTEGWGPTAAQARYEGRADLGNTQPGDGARYRGRGLIQTTGRANYRVLTSRLRDRLATPVPDFEAEPEQLATPRWAAWSAADYWDMRGLNALADAGEHIKIGRAINRGNPDSPHPANGEDDRTRRWRIARAAIAAARWEPPEPMEPMPAPLGPIQDATPTQPPDPGPPTERPPSGAPDHLTEDPTMAPFLAAALPSIINAIPQLGKLFASGSPTSERNVRAAELAVDIVQQAVGARNAQEAAEIVAADPGLAADAARAVRQRWGDILDLTEAGSGGIAGARQADAAASAADGPWWSILRSPSFVVACLLLPLVYLIVLSIIGTIGSADWSPDVRAAIAGTIVGTIIGGLVGYYYGQTTSRNRSQVQA